MLGALFLRTVEPYPLAVITLIAGGVCLSRNILGAHYLSDVIAGIGMAVIGLPLTMTFANMVIRKMKQEQLPKLL